MVDLRSWIRKWLGSQEPKLGPELERTGAALQTRPMPAPAPILDLPPPGSPERFVRDGNDFAVELYGQLRRAPTNLLFSPLSIRMALGMAHAGARGKTAAEMSVALRFSTSGETLHGSFAAILRRLRSLVGEGCELEVANSLWGQEGEPLQAEFLDLMQRHYGGGMNLVDFRSAAEDGRGAINHWVETETRQQIRDLIPRGALSASTRLVLVNAIYFKGTWVQQFHKAGTRNEPFRLESGKSVSALAMHQTERIRHMQGDGYQTIDLAYVGGDLSMLVLLPDRVDGLPALEQRLSTRMLDECVTRMREREVELFLPRFKVTWRAEVSDPLRSLGLKLAFTRAQADFSGINGREPSHDEALFVDKVFHQTFVAVDEQGTEAAAATAAGMFIGSPRLPRSMPVFRADHPFLFAIRDRRSGAILFLGRLVDPTQES